MRQMLVSSLRWALAAGICGGLAACGVAERPATGQATTVLAVPTETPAPPAAESPTPSPPPATDAPAAPTGTPAPAAQAIVPNASAVALPLMTAGPGANRAQFWTGVLGFSDVGTHQVVRTPGDRVYIFAPEIYKTYLRALRADQPGTPRSFAEVDAANRPNAASPIWAVDSAIDGHGVVHLLYITENGPVVYQTFDTALDRWGPQTELANSRWPNRNNDLRQGSAGVALAVDRAGVVHVAYNKAEGANRRVYYNNNAGGSWSHETLLDDTPGSDNSHPTLAFGPDGALYAAWLADDGKAGAIRVRARRGDAWARSSPVDAHVFRNDGYSIDQGPSLLVAPDGAMHVAYIGPYEPAPGSPTGYDYGRAHHRISRDGGRSWVADDPPQLFTHNPSLAVSPEGDIFMFGHREAWLDPGRCAWMLANVRPAGGGWDKWRVLGQGCFDSSVSVRWAQYHRANPQVIDLLFWTEKGPRGEPDVNQLFYTELRGGVAAIKALPGAARP